MARSQINVKVTPEGRGLEQLNDFLRAWEYQFQDHVDQRLADLRAQIRARARQEPGPASRPIEWTPSTNPKDAGRAPNTRQGYYSRQKAAFFRSNGFGKGIPTGRTHEVSKSWDVRTRKRKNDIQIELTNDSEAFPFAQGDWQQRMHVNTGWDSADMIVDDVTAIVAVQVPLIMDEVVELFLR